MKWGHLRNSSCKLDTPTNHAPPTNLATSKEARGFGVTMTTTTINDLKALKGFVAVHALRWTWGGGVISSTLDPQESKNEMAKILARFQKSPENWQFKVRREDGLVTEIITERTTYYANNWQPC
jgi:hypothetical protein